MTVKRLQSRHYISIKRENPDVHSSSVQIICMSIMSTGEEKKNYHDCTNSWSSAVVRCPYVTASPSWLCGRRIHQGNIAADKLPPERQHGWNCLQMCVHVSAVQTAARTALKGARWCQMNRSTTINGADVIFVTVVWESCSLYKALVAGGSVYAYRKSLETTCLESPFHQLASLSAAWLAPTCQLSLTPRDTCKPKESCAPTRAS